MTLPDLKASMAADVLLATFGAIVVGRPGS